MPEIDLDDVQRSLVLRPLTPADYDAVVALQRSGFPDMRTWTRDEFEKHLATFPEGQIGIEVEGRLAASSSSLILDLDEFSGLHTYTRITGGGTLSTHDPEGDTLYGIEVVVAPEFRAMRLGRRIYDARKALVRHLNLRRMVIGGRLPGFDAAATAEPGLTVQQYVERVLDRQVLEPVLTFQLANGFSIRRIARDYLPDDAASRGYAVLMEWVNLHHDPDPNEQARSTFPVRVCAVQYPMRPIASFADFAQQVTFFVDAAAGYTADFVVFPEILTLQLLSYLPHRAPGQAVRQLADLTADVIDLFQGLALKYAVNIVAGSHYAEEDGHLVNVSYLCRRDGSVDRQLKLHITPNERRWWGVRPGNAVNVFDTDRGKVAIAICYDVEFPEVARIAAMKGAQILFVPFCTDNRQGYLRVRLCAQARAIENQMFVVTAGVTGLIPSVENMDINYAQSAVFTPSDFPFARDGVAAECEPNIEALVVADLDLELLRQNRLTGTVRPWRDRRDDLYELLDHSATETQNAPSGDGYGDAVRPEEATGGAVTGG
ncbi:MAG TPA: bifunctional GNAT family N-acetyltransferase/carbon-nitrogen hydrolase family protein [Rubricoccaceae bacterium]|jgi:predicted amidohydrolase/ribosomal protein S18 acetylase RimI-like enzyme